MTSVRGWRCISSGSRPASIRWEISTVGVAASKANSRSSRQKSRNCCAHVGERRIDSAYMLCTGPMNGSPLSPTCPTILSRSASNQSANDIAVRAVPGAARRACRPSLRGRASRPRRVSLRRRIPPGVRSGSPRRRRQRPTRDRARAGRRFPPAAHRRQVEVALSHRLGHRQRPLVKVGVAVDQGFDLDSSGLPSRTGYGSRRRRARTGSCRGRCGGIRSHPGSRPRDRTALSRCCCRCSASRRTRSPSRGAGSPNPSRHGSARTGGRRLHRSAEVEERLVDLPDLAVTHVALRVPHRSRVVQPVGEHPGTAADTGDREVGDRGLLAVMVDAAALECVRRHRVRREHLLDEATGVQAGRKALEHPGEARDQEAPWRARRGLGVLVVGPDPGGKFVAIA